MANVIDHTGEILGKYKFLYQEGFNYRGEMTYAVQCMKCGFIRHGQVYGRLKSRANTKCWHVDDAKKHNNANWYSRRLRRIYTDMQSRCYNKNNASYSRYGGRGIKICDEWLNNSQVFNDWAIDSGYNDNLTIDRIDNYRGYSPDNCRWVTKEFNCAHQRTTYYVTVNGITHTFPEWCGIIGLEESRLNHLYHRKGMDAAIQVIKDYLDNGIKPKTFNRTELTIDGITLTAAEWAKKLGLKNTNYLNEYYIIHGKSKTLKRIQEIIDNPSSYKHQVHDPKIITIDGVSKSLSQWCDDLNLTKSTMYAKYRKNPKKVTKLMCDKYHEMESNKGPLVIKLGGLKIGLG